MGVLESRTENSGRLRSLSIGCDYVGLQTLDPQSADDFQLQSTALVCLGNRRAQVAQLTCTECRAGIGSDYGSDRWQEPERGESPFREMLFSPHCSTLTL